MIDNYKSLMAQVALEVPTLGQAMIHHANTRGQPMSFKDMPYLPQMYRDIPNLNEVSVMKAVQTGLSEFFICQTLYEAGWQGRIVGYVLPTFSIRDRFVSSRINKILMSSKSYRSKLPRETDLGNNRIKRFGKGSLLFLGSNTPGDFVEFSADTLIIDEIDQCDFDNITKGKDRIRASKSPKMYELGNPTLPGIGISKLFNESDQRTWHTKCPRCNTWQSLDWFENFVYKNDNGVYLPRDPSYKEGEIDLNNITYFKGYIMPVCRHCHKPFDRQDVGEWVNKYPHIDKAGYRMSRLDILSQDTGDLYKEWILAQGNNSRISTFFTSVLGKPFEFAGAKITSEMIHNCLENYDMMYYGDDSLKDKNVSMGVDVGALLNVQISIPYVDDETQDPKRKILLAIACRTFDELQGLISAFHVKTVVIDSMPELRKAQEIRDWGIDNGINIWLCRFYPTPRIGKEQYGRKLDYSKRIVTVDRTQIMDFTFDEIKNGDKKYPSDVMNILGWSEQMKAPVRVYDENKSKIIWTEGSKADHYRFADVYDRIAFDLGAYTATYTSI